MSTTEQIPGNMESIVANMALAHEMIMNDDFQLTSLNEATENNRFIFFTSLIFQTE